MAGFRVENWYIFDLREAAIYNAILGIVVYSILILCLPLFGVVVLVQVAIKETITPDLVGGALFLTGICVLLVIFGLVPNIFLLLGVNNDKPAWMLPWLALSYVKIIFLLLTIISPVHFPFYMTVYVTYSTMAVWSHYKNLKENKAGDAFRI